MAANGKLASQYFDKLKKNVIRNMVLDESVRLDGRKLNEIRPIWCEVDYLPQLTVLLCLPGVKPKALLP